MYIRVEELGMTNCPFNTLDNFRDLESINAFHELTEQGKMTEEDMMAAIGYKGRDNARTPMQVGRQCLRRFLHNLTPGLW